MAWLKTMKPRWGVICCPHCSSCLPEDLFPPHHWSRTLQASPYLFIVHEIDDGLHKSHAQEIVVKLVQELVLTALLAMVIVKFNIAKQNDFFPISTKKLKLKLWDLLDQVNKLTQSGIQPQMFNFIVNHHLFPFSCSIVKMWQPTILITKILDGLKIFVCVSANAAHPTWFLALLLMCHAIVEDWPCVGNLVLVSLQRKCCWLRAPWPLIEHGHGHKWQLHH